MAYTPTGPYQIKASAVERDAWRNALTGLTPGGSEYAIPDACVAAVRERFDGLHARTVDSHRERDRLRAEVVELVGALASVQFGFNYRRCPICTGWDVGPNGETDLVHTKDCPIGTVLAKHAAKEIG